MKDIIVLVSVLAAVLTVCVPVQGQSDLERKIAEIFLYQPREGEQYDAKNKVEQLGSPGEVKAVLLRMLTEHKHSKPGTKEFLYLVGATQALGEIKEIQAADALSWFLFDQNVDRVVRALAVKSLGQIDPEGNKDLLLRVMADVPGHPLTRIYAAEALAKTKDPQVAEALIRYSREEQDAYVRGKLEKAAQAAKTRVTGKQPKT